MNEFMDFAIAEKSCSYDTSRSLDYARDDKLSLYSRDDKLSLYSRDDKLSHYPFDGVWNMVIQALRRSAKRREGRIITEPLWLAVSV